MSTTPTARRRVITRQVVEWAAWDWGSAAFNAVATTFVFTTYLTSDGVFTDAGTASTWLSNGMTIAGLFIALLAPITGQRADRRGRGGVWLGWFTGLVVACMLAMYFVHPESVLGPRGALMLGIALLGLGNVFFEFASVNYNAMLNHLGEKEDRGKISGFGWASGYIGGIVLLLILYVGLIGANLLGVPTDEYLPIRISMVIAALWFGGFAIPVILHPPLPKKVHTGGDHESIIDSYKLLWRTVRTLKNEAPHTLFFLIASAVFRDGLAGVFTFGAVLAKTAF
ncbi:MAG: MFS transporter, partial [Winkia neuii]|nr:MFS transporter [Winkia neuii]